MPHDSSKNRESQWAAQLTGAVIVERSSDDGSTWSAVPSGDLPLGLQYSTSTNPERFSADNTSNYDVLTADQTEADGFPSGSDVDPWGAGAAGASSFGFRFVPNSTSGNFAPGEMLRVTVPIETNGNPPGCSTSDCSGSGDDLQDDAVAWNSFAFGGSYDDGSGSQRLLDSEPLKVGLKMADTANEASLGDFVWHDQDGNGVQDDGEPVFEGVTVRLYESDGTTLVAETLTDADGEYHFYGLDPNTDYVVKLDEPSDYNGGPLTGFGLTQQDSTDDGGNDTNDSDAALNGDGFPEISATTGGPGTDTPTYDFGFLQTNEVGDTVWYDLSGFNAQEPGAPGVENATVQLWDVGDDGVKGGVDDVLVETQLTDADGKYLFENVPNGTYYVDFDYSTITGNDPITGETVDPADWGFVTPDDTGDDTNDSDADPTDGATPTFSLNGNESNLTLDAGLEPATLVSLGSTVFEDSDNSGTHDDDEPGIAGVTVELYHSDQTPGVDEPIGSVVTNANGDYYFGDLPEGNYIVYIPTPPDSAPTSSTTTSTADNDVDGDDNGSQTASGDPVISPVINLSVGDEPTDGVEEGNQGPNTSGDNLDDLDDDRGNMTVDFGFAPDDALAVSLSYAYAERLENGTVRFIWETATETSNAGFFLYVLIGHDQQQVNPEMIPSQAIDSVDPLQYHFEAVVDGEVYIIEQMDIDGSCTMHGPFQLGQAYDTSSPPDTSSMTEALYLPLVTK